MLCPVCKTVDLVMSERQGIEIDYCPTCRGVWLDRGELDKIIERSMAADAPSAARQAQPVAPRPYPGDAPGYGHHGHHDKHHGKGYDQYGRRHSFWKDLFD